MPPALFSRGRHLRQLLPCRSPRSLALAVVLLGCVLGATGAWRLLHPHRLSFGDHYLAAWEAIRQTGAFRNPSYDLAVRRTLPDGVVVQYNPTHAVSKRPPSARGDALAVVRPFDPSAFNFNRVPAAEIMAYLEPVGALSLRAQWLRGGAADAPASPEPGADDHALIINASPLWLGHSLLVPALRRGLPQVRLSVGGAARCLRPLTLRIALAPV